MVMGGATTEGYECDDRTPECRRGRWHLLTGSTRSSHQHRDNSSQPFPHLSAPSRTIEAMRLVPFHPPPLLVHPATCCFLCASGSACYFFSPLDTRKYLLSPSTTSTSFRDVRPGLLLLSAGPVWLDQHPSPSKSRRVVCSIAKNINFLQNRPKALDFQSPWLMTCLDAERLDICAY